MSSGIMLGQGVVFLSVHYCESPLSQMAEWEAPFGVAAVPVEAVTAWICPKAWASTPVCDTGDVQQ